MENLIKALLIACVPILTTFLIRFINTKVNVIKSDQSMKEYLEYISLAEQVVIDVVVALNQTIVETAKLEGKFDNQMAKEVFVRAKNDIQVILSEKAKEAIKIIYGDVDIWLETIIESTVNENKITILE